MLGFFGQVCLVALGQGSAQLRTFIVYLLCCAVCGVRIQG
jgi:hypothetical protein